VTKAVYKDEGDKGDAKLLLFGVKL